MISHKVKINRDVYERFGKIFAGIGVKKK